MRSMWWLWCVVLAVVPAGCVQSSSVQCSDGVVCPSGTTCSASGCARIEELAACQGRADEDSCTTPLVSDGRCFDGSCVPSGCGNGFVESANGEVCDDKNQVPGDGCAADCRSDETCGNGIVDRASSETCDDGNTSETDQCRTTCVVPSCGDGKQDVQYNEGCDDGALSDAPDAACRTNCQPRRCGDGIKDVIAGEVCDDSNLVPGDDCTPDCESDETCGNDYTDFLIGETCDDANDLEGDGCAHTCAAEEFIFHSLALTAPPTRKLHAMAYDVDRGRVVMFGGLDDGVLLDDTWEWNGTTWVELTTAGSPPSRYGHAMTYDRARKRVVLFGGNAGSAKVADTWEWDGRAWLEVTPPTASPPARDGHALAYDARRGKVVMFGSGTGDGEVWEWSGAAWTRIAPATGPTQRNGHAMAYDPKRGRVVMFGGLENLTDRKNDTWEWNGTTWTDVTPVTNPVPPLAEMALVHDAAHDRLVLIGGSGFSDPGHTWAWNGSAWSSLAAGPITSQAAAAYDVERRQIIQFGGDGACGVEPETWLLDDATWTLLDRMPSQRRGHAMAYDDRARVVLMFGGGPESIINELAVTNELWSYDGAVWTALSSTTAPPPARTRHGMAYDGARQQMVVFGGVDNNGASLGDTWVWDGTAWTNVTPVTPDPAPRSRVGMAYDSIRQRVVLFGGVDGDTRFGDTWEWTGSAWEEITPATTSPLPRAGHGMAFDFYRQRVLLVAGSSINVSQQLVRHNDVWEWDGVDWVDRTPAGGPAPSPREDTQLVKLGGDRSLLMGGFSDGGIESFPWEWTGTSWSSPVLPPGNGPYQRTQHAMAFDTARNKAVIFGGYSGQTFCLDRRDTWEWTGTSWSRSLTRLQTAPTQRKFSTLAYDSVRAVSVLFGGAGLGKSQPARFRETWEWNGKHWTQVIAANPPPARTAAGLAYDAVRKVVVLFSGDTGTAARDTWTWNGTSWTDVSPAPSASPPARAYHVMTFDVARGVIVLFGGIASTTLLADTWEWNGTAWTDKTPSGTSPLARREANMVYDPARRRVVLFGGSGTAGRFNDVWEWDGTAWTLVTATGTPPLARQAAAAWFDPARRDLFVLGGFDGSFRDDVWELVRTPTSTSWRRIDPEKRPPARSTAVAVYDAAHREAIMFGGVGLGGFDDTSTGRYEESAVERCEVARDGDGDAKAGCADPDCWGICDPLCPPGATQCAASRPRCGDAVCNAALESCRICPGDCGTCTAACGDGWCDTGETAVACPGDCP